MKISIIVPSCGRPKILRNFFESLKEVKDKLPLETIIVINDESLSNRKEYIKIINKYRKQLNIKPFIFSRMLGSARARNEGLKKAKGDTIFFFDDDTELLSDYFAKILPLFKGKNVGAVGGAEIKKKSSKLHSIWFFLRKTGSVTKDGDIISNFFYDLKQVQSIDVDHLHGSNFGISREALKKVKCFDENFYGVYRDETDFIYRIKKKRYKVLFLPSTGVIHRETVKGGSIPPQKKKQWCYWYYRNTSYFFFKNIYKGNLFYLFLFLFRELIYSLLKATIYKNPYFITQYPKIIKGYKLARKK